jgi:hypothetical protein
MAFGSDRSANFVIKAKDAATGPLGKVGGAMGKLKGASVTAFKAIGVAAAAAAAAITAFVADAVKGAMEDERSTILTNAALRARGFELDKLAPKIEEQIKAAQRLGIADDRVRAGLEVGSRYFKNQEKLLKANALATTISAVTGEDLESVVAKIGKAANGSTRGLAALIGPIEKGATLSDLYAQGMGKFKDVADELANSTSGKALAAQEAFNESMDQFGAKFLPIVTEALTFIVEEALPAFQKLLDDVGPIIMDLVDNFVRPLIDSVAELFSMFESGEDSISILELALLPLKVTLTAIKTVIDAIIWGLKQLGFISNVDKAAMQASDNAFRAGERGTMSSAGIRAGSSENVRSGIGMAPVSLTIGTKAQSELAYKYGAAARTATATRNTGRNR